jgi:glycerophosphoryl diester phosphodiesterase
VAAAEQGAGVIECDVTFTRDLALVCRHSQCDLATTTNILQTPLAAKCSKPFRPANGQQPASATCCTTDISLAEFKTLCARPDQSNKRAKTVSQYLAPLHSPVISEPLACGTLMTHAQSIELIDTLGRKFTPELKRSMVDMPFAPGFTQAAYADKLLAEYRAAGIDPSRVYPQSFNPDDIWHWVKNHPDFADQAIWLDARGRRPGFQSSPADFAALRKRGLNIIAPPMPMLLALNDAGEIVPSIYARQAKSAGLEIITWTFEAGDPVDANNWLYAPISDAMTSEGQVLQALHVLANDVGVRGVFSDWPGTVTYYANCLLRSDREN